jgi:WD40 repeat protein
MDVWNAMKIKPIQVIALCLILAPLAMVNRAFQSHQPEVAIDLALEGWQGEMPLALTPDMALIARFQKGGIEVISALDGKVVQRFPIPEGYCHALALSDDGRWLAAALPKRRAEVWNLDAGARSSVIRLNRRLYGVRFLPHSTRLVTYTHEPPVVWDVSKQPPIKLPTKLVPRSDATFSLDGKIAAQSEDRGVVVFDLDAQREIARYRGGSNDYVRAVAISPDTQKVAVAGNEVQMWRIGHEDVDTIDVRNQSFVAFSADGNRLFVAGVGVAVHDLKAHRQLTSALPNARLWGQFSQDAGRFMYHHLDSVFIRDLNHVLTHRLLPGDLNSSRPWWPASCEDITKWPGYDAAQPYNLRRASEPYVPIVSSGAEPISLDDDEQSAAIAAAKRIADEINPDLPHEFEIKSAWDLQGTRTAVVESTGISCSFELAPVGPSPSYLRLKTGFLRSEDRSPERLRERFDILLKSLGGEPTLTFSGPRVSSFGIDMFAAYEWHGAQTPWPYRIHVSGPEELPSDYTDPSIGGVIQGRFPTSLRRLQKDLRTLHSYRPTAKLLDILPRAVKTLVTKMHCAPTGSTIAVIEHRVLDLRSLRGWQNKQLPHRGADKPLLDELENRGRFAPFLCIDVWDRYGGSRMCFHPETGQLVALISPWELNGDLLTGDEDD